MSRDATPLGRDEHTLRFSRRIPAVSQTSIHNPPHIDTGLTRDPLTPRLLPNRPDCGGECIFLGRTRGEDHPSLGPLTRLDYEAYEPMAAQGLDRLARQIAEEFACGAVVLIHRLGPVAVGEPSVLIQTAAPHRAEAFAACRAGIDRLKAELPIWKREIWQHGETFVDGQPAQATAHEGPGHHG